MPRCSKVKNPCKICLSQVTTKNGLQCQGACKTWVHFDCLNYTPGRISDIKAGVIKVTCPCPDCKSVLPREYRTDEPYCCNNSYCPANRSPKCDNQTCSVNINNPQPSEDEKRYALNQCGRKKCKQNSTPHLPRLLPSSPCTPAQSFSVSNSGCTSSYDIPGDHGRSSGPYISMDTLEQMCDTVGQLANQLNSLMTKMKKNGREKRIPGCGNLDCSPRGAKPCYCPEKYVYTIIPDKKVLMDNSIKFQLLIVACINIGQLIVGYSVGWSAPIIPKLQDTEQTPLPELITDFQASWIGSLLYIGAMVGPYATGFLSNVIGRKPCLAMGAILNILAYLLVVTTNNLAMVYAIRVVSGLGMGITIVGNIVYVGEIASTHIRGILLTSTSIMGITGTLVVYSVAPFVSYVATGYIALAICFVHIITLIFIPESPVYYAMKGDDVKAAKALNLLGRSYDVEKLLETYCNKGNESTKLKDWIEIFTIKSNRMSLFITFTLGTLQQLSGVAVVLFFATTIFELAGSTIRSDIATIIIGVTRLVSSLIAPLFIERSGRRLLLLISMTACALSLGVLGLYFYFDRVESDFLDTIGWLPLFALIIYFFSYEAGFGTIPNAIVGEMFCANVRSNGSAMAITLTWLVGFALTTSFTTMINELGGDVTFWIFGGSCVVSFFFVFFCVPETKGKTLKEIQDMMINIGQFIDGYSVGWSAPIIPKLQDPDQTPLPNLITDLEASWIGPYIPSYLSNIIGRKPCLFFGGLLNLIAIILIIVTKNVAMVYAIRIISGIGMGMVTVSNLVYVGEIASTHIRGILLTSTSIVGITGTLAAYSVGSVVSYAGTGYFVLAINIIHVIGIYFIPESPVYYAIKGKEMEAKKVLRSLGRLDDLENVFDSVKGTNPGEANSWKAWIKIFTVKANRKSLFITLSLCTLQQTSGVAAVLFFATTIFQIAGSSIRPDLATIIIGATRLIASCVAPFVVERAGRRILLLVSTAACALSLSTLGTYFYLSRIESEVIAEVGWLPLAALIMYFFSYEIGFGTMPSALVGEMFRGNARSTGSAVSMTTAWLIGFGIATGFGTMVKVLGGDVTFGIFSASCVVAFWFTYQFVPETKGKNLNEIQELLMYLGQMIVGFYGAWPGTILPKLRDPYQSPVPYKLTETELSLVATMTMLGSIPGPYASGWLSNTIGRKPCIIAGGILLVIGSAILAAARNLAMLYCARLLLGFAGGIVGVMNVVYIGEIASTNIRGILLTAIGIFMTVGSILLFSIGPLLSYFLTTSVGLALSIVFTLGAVLLPESPTFYIIKGNEDKAIDVLQDLGRLEDVTKLESANKEFIETTDKQDWKELFSIRSNRKAFLITVIINILQNCSGLLAVINFSASIFEMAGSSIKSNISMVIIVGFQLVGSIITPFFIERAGRKRILLISCATCCISMFILGLYFYLNYVENSIINKLKWLPLVILIIYFIGYNFGYGIIPNTIIGEMFTPKVRSKGSTLTMSISWVFGFTVNTVFGMLLESVGGHFAFWFFSLVCACAFIFTLFFIPETKGKSLLEIQELLNK
ncbi:uncharacterized protein LOC123877526 [Maniola jurtina]|uniref:uncharacterized protein LOC123877526 n=1 Tax=Maniola jurtina TaxID=191418 RepID=UPI001E686142|nr:uncharacterized protein LOC123877526 [Maniola jurtina]